MRPTATKTPSQSISREAPDTVSLIIIPFRFLPLEVLVPVFESEFSYMKDAVSELGKNSTFGVFFNISRYVCSACGASCL